MFWQTKDRQVRGMGAWSQVFGAMVVEADGGAGYPTSQPLRDDYYHQDIRFSKLGISWPIGFPSIAKGSLLLHVAGTEESAQHTLAMWADPRLIAPQSSGPGTAGTIVVDLGPDNELCMGGGGRPGQSGRQAQLQSLVRVIAVPPGQSLGNLGAPGNVLALNYTLTTQEGMAGLGAIWTRVTGRATGGGGGGRGPTTPGSGAVTGNGQRVRGSADPDSGFGASSNRFGPGEIDTGFGSRLSLIPGSNPGGDEEKTPRDFGKLERRTEEGKGIALMAAEAYGPIHGGNVNDKHNIGFDADGHPINSAHISCNALYYKTDERDGPLHFEGLYPGANSYPLSAKVHLGWDRLYPHTWLRGSQLGMWRWWAEVPYYAPNSRPNYNPPTYPPPNVPGNPPGPTTPGGGGSGGPGTPGPGAPGGPTPGSGSGPGTGRGGPTTGGPSGPTTGGPARGDTTSDKKKGAVTKRGATTGTGKPPLGPGRWKPAPIKYPPGTMLPGVPGGHQGGKTMPQNPATSDPDNPDSGSPTTPSGNGSTTTGTDPAQGGICTEGDPSTQADPNRPLQTPVADYGPAYQAALRKGQLTNLSAARFVGGPSGTGTRAKDPRISMGRLSGLDPHTLEPTRIPGVVERVGSIERDTVGAYSILHPLQEGFASLGFRPQLWANGAPNFEHNPQVPALVIEQDEALRPQVLTMRAWGAQSAATGDWKYAEQPGVARTRGGTANGGVMFGPPRFEMEDYFGINSAANVADTTSAKATTGYVLAAPGVAFALGKPSVDGGLQAQAVVIQQDLTATASPLKISHDGSEVFRAVKNGSEVLVDLGQGGSTAVKIPYGTSAQRPATPQAGMLRINTNGANHLLEFYDPPSGAWVQPSGGGGGGGTIKSFGQVAVAGQTTVTADVTIDTLNLVAGGNVILTTQPLTNSVTIAAIGVVGDGNKGEITVTGSGTNWSIDDGAVTWNKIQHTSADSVLIGRGDVSAGEVEEISLGAGLLMSGTTVYTDPLLDGGSF
jgi:hypothetical protein